MTANDETPSQRGGGGANRLSAEDWIEITLDEWAKGDAPSITINTLARRLGVTKGSFYWHFDSREDLLKRALDEWRRRTTTRVIDKLANVEGRPHERLEQLLELPTHAQAQKFARIEETVRNWALADELAAAIVREVDSERIHFLATIFGEAGCPLDTARDRGYLAYCMLVGDARLRHTTSDSWRDAFREQATECLLPGS